MRDDTYGLFYERLCGLYTIPAGYFQQILRSNALRLVVDCHAVAVDVIRCVRIDRERVVIGRSNVPMPVVVHQEAEILVMVIDVPAQNVQHHRAEQLPEFPRRHADTASCLEQCFVRIRRGVHGSQCLDMHLLAVLAVETLGQEVRCLLAFKQAARHHLKLGIHSHQVIAVFYPCRRHLLVFVELDDHRRVARIRGRHLSGVTLSLVEIDVDHCLGPSPSCGRTHLEQAFDHQVARYRDVEPSGFLESLPGQLVEIGDLDLERCLQFLGSGRDELQCPHATPSDIGETVEGGQVPHTDMMHFGPFVEHGVSPMVGQ